MGRRIGSNHGIATETLMALVLLLKEMPTVVADKIQMLAQQTTAAHESLVSKMVTLDGNVDLPPPWDNCIIHVDTQNCQLWHHDAVMP